MEVLSVFKYAPHGILHALLIEFFPMKGDQGRGPIQCLRDSGTLEEIHLSDLLHKGANLFGQERPYLRVLSHYDLVLLFKGGVFNPVVETAAFQSVMNFPGTI